MYLLPPAPGRFRCHSDYRIITASIIKLRVVRDRKYLGRFPILHAAYVLPERLLQFAPFGEVLPDKGQIIRCVE